MDGPFTDIWEQSGCFLVHSQFIHSGRSRYSKLHTLTSTTFVFYMPSTYPPDNAKKLPRPGLQNSMRHHHHHHHHHPHHHHHHHHHHHRRRCRRYKTSYFPAQYLSTNHWKHLGCLTGVARTRWVARRLEEPDEEKCEGGVYAKA